MNSIQLDQILKGNKTTKSSFKGVFARDELPIISSYPSCFVINTAKRNHPGQHWIAIYIERNKTCTFFDSFGNHPSYFKLMRYITNNSNRLIFNRKVIQGLFSQNCGYYCVLFLILKSSGYSMEKISDIFYNIPEKNDQLINKYKTKF